MFKTMRLKGHPKSQKKSERTRQIILDTALKLFQEQGFEKTTMRAIAAEAMVSLGAAYYYFKSKEELVLTFYQQTADEARDKNSEFIEATRDFKSRFRAIIDFKLNQLGSYRHLAKVLAQQAADVTNPLSPFSPETKPIRDDAIDLIQQAIEGSNLRASKKLAPHLAKLLWLYQMGIILFWANDKSKDQKRSQMLLSYSLNMLNRLLRISALPLMNPVNRAMVRIIGLVESCAEEKWL